MSRASRVSSLGTALILLLVLVGSGAAADPAAPLEAGPGAPGIGDDYFPLDGNGGYDVVRYRLDIGYQPGPEHLSGVATITARAMQRLSAFNLDLQGLTVESVTVDGVAATWSRDGGELTIVPAAVLPRGHRFSTVVVYNGVPETIEGPFGSLAGAIKTDDGVMILGQPHVAATWFPANDHPTDRATYRVNLTVPNGLEALSNGRLAGSATDGMSTTWQWRERDPMASYLAMAAIGQFDVRAYRDDGRLFWDAVDPDHFTVPEPPTGAQYAISQKADTPAYRRLARTISVPAGEDAELSFWITRDTEPRWDYVFVEAHTVGEDDWTTLRDRNGHTSADTGRVCPYWLDLHPFLRHYQTADGDTCSARGTTGRWWAATGDAHGSEEWAFDLSAYAGHDVEVSISYAGDDIWQGLGVFIDDVVVSTGAGSTSFEDDADPFDGWTVPGAPPGSSPNENDWILGTPADAPEPLGVNIDASLARQGEILDFLEGVAGRYPFSSAGAIVDDNDDLGYALENQTRPIYAKGFFYDRASGASGIVHELAHEWYGDSLAVRKWRHIWLNEGFATYAEWLWAEHEGYGSAQETFDAWYDAIPADDPFWAVVIGDPGAESLFDGAVYTRGAMTLHQLRVAIGDDDFFHLLRRWAQTRENSNVASRSFKRVAERISGQQLDELFLTWLFTPEKPDLGRAAPVAATPTLRDASPLLRPMLDRLRLQGDPLWSRLVGREGVAS